MKQKSTTAQAVDFEKALGRLEEIIAKLEEGDLPLEEAVKQFGEGIKLAKDCRQTLEEAEQRVRILMQKNDRQTLEDFKREEEDDPEA